MGQYGKCRSLVGAFLALLLADAAHAAPCRQALLLALDVSSSVDAKEDRLQRQGLMNALIAPEVQAAFFAHPAPVALAVYEWSGRYQQQVLLDWRLIATPADLIGAAEALHSSTRAYDDFPTAMGYGLGYGAGMLEDAPDCLREVIDVSGDGKNNDGFTPENAYEAFPFYGVIVNGLVIAAPGEEGFKVVDYYRRKVIRGPGAFVEIADGFEDFERAMRRKLLRELGGLFLGEADTDRDAG